MAAGRELAGRLVGLQRHGFRVFLSRRRWRCVHWGTRQDPHHPPRDQDRRRLHPHQALESGTGGRDCSPAPRRLLSLAGEVEPQAVTVIPDGKAIGEIHTVFSFLV